MHRIEKIMLMIITILFVAGGAWLYQRQTKMESRIREIGFEVKKNTTVVLPDAKGQPTNYPLSQVMMELNTIQGKDGEPIVVKDIVMGIVKMLEENKATSTNQ